MNYIYDIVLNFNKDYYEFFQWKKGDKIINVKKIPAFKVNDDDLRSLKYNIVKVSKEFIDRIFDLTLFYNKMDTNYKYMCLVSNTNETIGLMFNNEGRLIKRSSLVFDEEEEVNEEVLNEEILSIDYVENNFKKVEYISRIDKERRDYLFKFINNLDIDRDGSILKYMYYDYFEQEEEDISKIKDLILKELNSNTSDKNKLYDLVKVFRKIKN